MASINRLLRFVGIIAAQYVGVEPREICQTRWTGWQKLAAGLGLTEEALPLTLDAPSRALLLLLQSCAARGNKTATFTVRPPRLLLLVLLVLLVPQHTGTHWDVCCPLGSMR